MNYDVFNGDADGICALLQLRKAEPRDATLVTGVKRDINLLAKVDAASGDRITVLDVSMDTNRAALDRALASAATVFYVDHHFSGDIPQHPNLTAIINEAADVCTAVLVNGHLKGRHLDWAVTGAFGDNLQRHGAHTGQGAGHFAERTWPRWKHLAPISITTAMGLHWQDLHFDPKELYLRLYAAADPLDFVHHSPDFKKLSTGYHEDMALAEGLQPLHSKPGSAVFLLPDQAWARRVSGVYSNDLATGNPAPGSRGPHRKGQWQLPDQRARAHDQQTRCCRAMPAISNRRWQGRCGWHQRPARGPAAGICRCV